MEPIGDKIEDFVRKDLDLLEQKLEGILCSDPKLLSSVGKHLMASRGKRIRPMLTFLAARLGKPNDQLLAVAAASIELIHTATLLHDDSIDQSYLRRGVPTVNCLWDDHTSVVVGDYLFCTAFKMLHENGLSEVAGILSCASQMLTLGEIHQMDWRGRYDISEAMYLEMVRLKTASLFASACEIGAMLGQVDRSEREALRAYGENLGVAFQIVDDVLDFIGDVSKMGKPVGNDLRDGRITLPLIISLANARPEVRASIRRAVDDRRIKTEDWQKIVEFVVDGGGVKYSMDLASSFIQKALVDLNRLRECKQKLLLVDMARFVISRHS